MHLPGAVNIPLKTLDSATTSALDRDRPVVMSERVSFTSNTISCAAMTSKCPRSVQVNHRVADRDRGDSDVPAQPGAGAPPRGTTTAVGRHSGGHRLLITTGGAELARRTGLTDRAGRLLRGVPPLVNGAVCDVAAMWRGAFLTRVG